MTHLKFFYQAYKELSPKVWDGVGSSDIEEYFSGELDIELVVVKEDFENGGRWYNFQTKVYQIGDEFYELCEQVPATENQEGSEYGVVYVQQVEPKEVIQLVYKSIKEQTIRFD